MKIWEVAEVGGPFRIQEREIPKPGPGQVLLRVAASAVNPLDTKIRAGIASHARHPLPAVLGIDVAGTIEEVGPGVTSLRAGDQVYGAAGGVGGLQGSLAEFMVADALLLARKPRNLSMNEASAMPLGVITAWEGLVDRGNVQADDAVLVHGGAGGVGNMVVQLAIALGARVHATVSPSKAAVVEALGAIPIDYTAFAPEDYIQSSPGSRGWDIVYDTVGNDALEASFKTVRKYSGRAVSCLGWGTYSLAPLSFRGASYSGVFTLLPLLSGEGQEHHGEILAQAARLAEAGKLKPLLDKRIFRTTEIEAAHSAVAAGSLGKVVVQISN
jgi:NADPH:quinone reductase-like Zn-dependent oxidoreductase